MKEQSFGRSGSENQMRATPGRAFTMYIDRAITIAKKHSSFFDCADPDDAFVVTDDFVSSGRISGAKSIPISRLKVGSFHSVEGKQLQVNSSAQRYQRKIDYLASILWQFFRRFKAAAGASSRRCSAVMPEALAAPSCPCHHARASRQPRLSRSSSRSQPRRWRGLGAFLRWGLWVRLLPPCALR